MRFTGKAQQRPLDLLKLVVAQGGDDVESAAVTAALWPEADGAAAKTSFDTALFRLRKLLDVDGAVRLAGGKLSLAPELVWTDVRAFEAGARRRAARAPRRGARRGAIARAARELLAAYPGPLLGTRGGAVAGEAARRAARAPAARAAALGEGLEARRGTGPPRSTSIVAASRPTTSPSRSTAA